ncbi:MAG: hypothetical protein KDK36_02690, partial [Leptospiraceae bacterium]|nr:hypothetical protein [Leptospiraceae bacterium]
FIFTLALIIIFYPLNSLFQYDMNLLPLQFLVLLLFVKYFFVLKHINKIPLTLILISVFIATYFTTYDMSSYFSSALILTFVTLYIISLIEFRQDRKIFLDRVITYAIFFFIAHSLILNYDYSITQGNFVYDNINLYRSKSFGSLTTYALLSTIFIIHFFLEFIGKRINAKIAVSMLILLFWNIYVTLLRGAMLNLLACGIFIFVTKKFKNKAKLIITICASAFFLLMTDSRIVARLNPDNFTSINEMSSGRLYTLMYIVETYYEQDNFLLYFFGNGINSIKEMNYTVQLEFPHFDLFYIFFEGGLILLIIYFFFLRKLYLNMPEKVFFWFYIVTSMHTNSLNMPFMLFLLYLVSNFNKNLITEKSSVTLTVKNFVTNSSSNLFNVSR